MLPPVVYTGVSVPPQEPVKDIAAPILQRSPRDAPGPRSPSPTRDVSMPILQTSARGVSDQIFQPSSRDALPPRASTSTIDALTPSSPTLARDVADLNSQTTVEDVPISQVSANDTPGTKTFVDVHISKPRLKPPDPNAYEVAPILSARPVQKKQ